MTPTPMSEDEAVAVLTKAFIDAMYKAEEGDIDCAAVGMRAAYFALQARQPYPSAYEPLPPGMTTITAGSTARQPEGDSQISDSVREINVASEIKCHCPHRHTYRLINSACPECHVTMLADLIQAKEALETCRSRHNSQDYYQEFDEQAVHIALLLLSKYTSVGGER